MNNALYKRRLLINKFNLTMAWATMAFGLFWLAWILITLFGQGMDGLLDIKTYTMDTPPSRHRRWRATSYCRQLIGHHVWLIGRHAHRHLGGHLLG